MISKKLFLFSLTSLSFVVSNLIYAGSMGSELKQPNKFTASIGTFYTAPDLDHLVYTNNFVPSNVFRYSYTPVVAQSNYDWGIEAKLGYIFNNEANGIELSYRGLDSDSHNRKHSDVGVTPCGITFPVGNTDVRNKVDIDYDNADLMLSQVLPIKPNIALRFLAGASYLHFKEASNTTFTNILGDQFSGLNLKKNSKYNGYGPRVGIDSRYELGNGFGFLAGGSVAYFTGKMDYNDINALPSNPFPFPRGADKIDHHAVVNLRGKIGLDYVYQLQSTSTVGIELGYQADNYNNVFSDICTGARFDNVPNDPSGPNKPAFVNAQLTSHSSALDGFYVNLKATFG